MPSTQIPIPFPIAESYTRDSFMPSQCNEDALAWIDRWPNWPSPALIIHGPKGCGKTHLLHIWKDIVGEQGIAIDNSADIFGNKDAEEGLFHAYNLAKENGTYLMISMEHSPAVQDIQLPDLASRLRASAQASVHEPDDIAIQSVMIKLMHDRQMKITPEVVNFILPRIERSYTAVRHLVEGLDIASLSEKRAITIPLVKTIIKEPELL